jgi:protein gp37
MENTNIEWTDHTFNPWMGCTKVSPGCDHCYAERDMDHRLKRVQWGPQGERVRTVTSNWRKPVQWNAAHAEFFAKHGRRQRVFCASLADVFDNAVDPTWRRDLFDLIELTPNLDWLLLTKRVGNVAEMVARAKVHDWLAGQRNVWLGISVVSQFEADRDIPKLLALPARVRFLSMEPLLGQVDLRLIPNSRGHTIHVANRKPHTLDWVIVGGESGPQARQMLPEWARSLRDQCQGAGVPFLFKQWGEWAPYDRGRTDSGKMATQSALDDPVTRYGKKLAGRHLDGQLHDGYPKVSV